MGREVKRVSVGFDWPLGKTWAGYLNPFHTAEKCSACDGTGLSSQAKHYQEQWYGYHHFDPLTTGSIPFGPNHPIVQMRAERNVLWDYRTRTTRTPDELDRLLIQREAVRLASDCFDNHWSHHLSQEDVDALLDSDRLIDLTSTFVPGEGWKKKEPPHRPTAKEVNEWSIGCTMGHDGINQWVCVQARCKREGVPYRCESCKGEGQVWGTQAAKSLWESWSDIEPPTGPAYQIWETTTEGSPITPAFDSADELADWCFKHQFDDAHRTIDDERWNRIAGGTGELSKDQWLTFILGDVPAMSMVVTNGVVQSGVEFLASKEESE